MTEEIARHEVKLVNTLQDILITKLVRINFASVLSTEWLDVDRPAFGTMSCG